MKFLKLALLSIIFVACTKKVPSGIMTPQEMKFVLFDIMRADEYANNFLQRDTTDKPNTKNIRLYEQVFKIHNKTKEEFYRSYKYYGQHPDINKILYDSLAAYASRKREQLSKAKPSKSSK